MNSQSFSLLSFHHLIFITTFLNLLQCHNGSITCSNTFTCGNTITQIGYPFRGSNDPPYCGHPSLVLSCDDQSNITTIDITNTRYQVLEIYQTNNTMRIVREDIIQEGLCPQEIANTTLDFSIFDYADTCMNFTLLYGCPIMDIPGLSPISCGNEGHNSLYVLPGTQVPGNSCNTSVIVPVLIKGNGEEGSENTTNGLDQMLRHGFDVRWNVDSQACRDCTESTGRCGYDFETNQTTCYCPDSPFISGTCLMGDGSSTTNGSSGSGKYDMSFELNV